MTNYKQAILVRNDLKLTKGKLATQASHSSVEATLKSKKEILEKWRSEGMKKIILKVDNLEELNNFEKLAKKEKIVTAKIRDAGKTQIPAGTITCLAIGPDKEEKIDKLTNKLKLV